MNEFCEGFVSVLFTVVLSHISLSHRRGSVHIGQLEGRSISSVVRGCSGPYPSGWWFPEVREALLSLRGCLRAGDHLWVGSVRWPSQQSSGLLLSHCSGPIRHSMSHRTFSHHFPWPHPAGLRTPVGSCEHQVLPVRLRKGGWETPAAPHIPVFS